MNKDTLQGYGCLAVAATLAAVIVTIMIASIAHWLTT
jgi:hypothetical protein